MARLYLNKTSTDLFETLADGQVLSTDPTWVKMRTVASDIYESSSLTRVFMKNTGLALRTTYVKTHTPASADYASIVTNGGMSATAYNQLGAVVRSNTPGANDNCYYGRWGRPGGGVWTLIIARIIAGSAAALASIASGLPSVGATLRLEATTNGNQVDLAVFLDESDTAALTYSDTSASRITAVGQAGIFMDMGSSEADQVPYIDEWSAYEAAEVTRRRFAPLVGNLAGAGQIGYLLAR